jgi:uncharacterized protein
MTEPSLIISEPRTYRDFAEQGRFRAFRAVVETSDLYVRALLPLERETESLIRDARSQIEAAIARRPEFLTGLSPIPEDLRDGPVALNMIRAGRKAGTGPMAAVAGAVAEFVGRGLLERSPEVMIENGGDIFVHTAHPAVVGIFAGTSPLSGRMGLRIEATPVPLGICTSSGTVGPSMSFGIADAATIVSRDVPLADAAATALGNMIQGPSDLKKAVESAMRIPGVLGALAIIGEHLAAVGEIELVPFE